MITAEKNTTIKATTIKAMKWSVLWIPIWIENDDCICSVQIHTQPTGACGQQKAEISWVWCIEMIHRVLTRLFIQSFSGRHSFIQSISQTNHQYNAIQCNAMDGSTQHNATQHNTTQHNTSQHNTTQHNTTNTTHTQHTGNGGLRAMVMGWYLTWHWAV